MNMPIEEDFRDAADRATKLPKRPPNDVLLQLYSLYKQGTEGDAVSYTHLTLPRVP